MNRPLARWMLAFVLLMQVSPGHAEVEFVNLVPAQPQTNESISAVLHYEGCDGLFGGQEVTQSGRMIRMIVDGARLIEPFCLVPPNQYAYPIGMFEAGTWVLQIDYRHNDETSPGDTVIETIDTITFDVLPSPAGAAPTPVPTLGWWGGLGLALLALAAAVHAASRRIIRSRTRT